MRDFRVQAIINLFKVLKKREMGLGELSSYLTDWIFPATKRPTANKLYDRRDLGYFRKLLFGLGKQDPLWFPRLVEPTSLGLRGWEYALLFDKIHFKKKKILDVGPGSSRLPSFLVKRGAEVAMLDIENPLEETEQPRSKKLKFVLGDMTKMNFKDITFDVVICISALEHVDMKGQGFYGEKEYFKRSILATREMIRVLKPGGDFYLTTEFFLPNQKTDNWVYSKGKIRGAFKFDYLQKMVALMIKEGIVFDSTPEIDSASLENDQKMANFRGRYISTFAFRGKKL